MSIELQRKTDAKMAHTLRIGAHEWLVDGSVAEGGDDLGPNPHDLYDASVAACKALTLVWYARKKGYALDDVRTEVTRDASQERQGVYRLSTRLLISGDLTDAQVQEMQVVAGKCPVHKLMTDVRTEITTTVERAPG